MQSNAISCREASSPLRKPRLNHQRLLYVPWKYLEKYPSDDNLRCISAVNIAANSVILSPLRENTCFTYNCSTHFPLGYLGRLGFFHPWRQQRKGENEIFSNSPL